MKHLVFLCEMQDADAAALDYGDGDLGDWIADSLAASLECDCSESSEWARTVATRHGMTPEKALAAFRGVRAGFLRPAAADAVLDALRQPGNAFRSSREGGEP